MGKIISAPTTGGGGTTLDLSFITATSDKILTGYTGSDNDGNPIEGSMVNNGAKTASLNAGGSYTIPTGYHNGSGKVTANSLASQTSANAVASDILSGKNAWVNGVKVNGSMVNQGAKTASLNAGGSYTIPAGYHNGSGKVTANSLASQTSANAGASHILTGYNAWVNGVKINGSITTMAGQTITPTRQQQQISCNEKYMNGNITVGMIPYIYCKKYTYKGGTHIPVTIPANSSAFSGNDANMNILIMDMDSEGASRKFFNILIVRGSFTSINANNQRITVSQFAGWRNDGLGKIDCFSSSASSFSHLFAANFTLHFEFRDNGASVYLFKMNNLQYINNNSFPISSITLSRVILLM